MFVILSRVINSTSRSISSKESKWEDANKEAIGSYDKGEGRICAEEWKDMSIVKRGEIYEFIKEYLRKGYIRLSKLFQTALVFFVGKKNSKKCIV